MKTQNEFNNQAKAQKNAQIIEIAAFDFDGTITTRDSFLIFMLFLARKRFRFSMLAVIFPLMIYPFHKNRGRLKGDILSVFWGGIDVDVAEDLSQRFVVDVMPNYIRHGAIEELHIHKMAGRHVCIVSASPEIYIKYWAKQHGVETVLATKLQIMDEKLTGPLDGQNCRKAEKVRRLQDHFGMNTIIHSAYGDTDGDTEMLEAAQNAYFKPFRKTTRA